MTASIRRRSILAVALLAAVPTLTAAQPATAQQAAAPREETILVDDQRAMTPGYAIGNVAIGDPKVADFKVMDPRRLDVVIFGKGPGTTRLTLWDQKNVKRDEIVITVTTRQAQNIEKELREMLKDFPSVELRPFAGTLTVTGAVSSRDDLAAIEKIAEAAKVRSLVRYVPPAGPEPGTAAPAPAAAAAGSNANAATVVPTAIEYEVELLEASARFRSGSYATGVEPSGRSLFKGIVRAPIGVEKDLFIGGNAVRNVPKSGSDSKSAGNKKGAPAAPAAQPVQTGIKLTVRPSAPDPRGSFKTFLLIETNLPFDGGAYDPAIWRRARWEFSTAAGEPFGITGGDLLATPDMATGGLSAIGAANRAASTATMVPKIGMAPGAEYVPIFGSLFGSRSYKQRTTQLLVIVRTRATAAP